MLGGIESIGKIPELRNRLLFTLGLLAVYRIGCAIPTPGIDTGALASFFAQAQNTIFGMFNLFSGGALERLSIFTLGIMPYISASIILQLLTVVIPYLDRLSKEGELGRKKITQYTRYGTVVLSLLQGAGTAVWLEGMKGPAGEPVVMNPGPAFIIMTMLTMTSGTAFIMWLGEQITERGVGNGISLIIFAGIVARMPAGVLSTFSLARAGELSPFKLIAIGIIMVAVVAFIIFMERGQRRIPIQYAKRVVGRKVYGGQSTHLPLKVNTAGVIPPIFASSLLIFPSTIASLANFPGSEYIRNALSPSHAIYNLLYVAGIIFFCYFYTAVQFNPIDVAENLKKYGGYIPGIRPGSKTAEYIDLVLTRITLGGSLYVAAVCVLPALLVSRFNVPFWYGGTSLMIVVGVGMDTIAQIESHMLSRHYEGFLGRQKIKGRRG
ncbi:MAG: preprotein translocase subunit SecY [bacterium]|nr:preprotein translocase subunit SecY [bacterium]